MDRRGKPALRGPAMIEQRYVLLKATRETVKTRGGAVGSVLSAPEALREIDVTAEAASLSPQELKELRGAPEVLRAAPVMPVLLMQPKTLAGVEMDASDVSGATWGLDAVGAAASPFTGAGVTVAVLDTGIDAGHEAFRNSKILQRDFTGEGDGDQNGHGTHCAGTLFGGSVEGVRIGVAPGVKQALVGKVLDQDGAGSTECMLDGLLWAIREGASVVSMSIGFDFPGMVRYLIEKQGLDPEPATSRALLAYRENVRLFDAIAALARAHNSLFSNAALIAASGNESSRPRYEIATAPPAAADGFISVGALLKQPGKSLTLGVASFSNSLPVVSAPGVGIKSARAGGGLVAMNGTSMAAPHVAGVAALWLEQIRATNPVGHVRQLEGRLIGNATLGPIPSPEDRTNAGAGLVQAPRSI
jgi:subtilisin family serine protease